MSFSLRPDITVTDTEHGCVLLDQRRGRYFHLNLSGALVLSTLLDGMSPEHAAQVLCERYGIGLQQAATDVASMLSALRKAKLVTA